MCDLRADGLLPWYYDIMQYATKATCRLTRSERKTKYRTDGEWENSALSGIIQTKEVIVQ